MFKDTNVHWQVGPMEEFVELTRINNLTVSLKVTKKSLVVGFLISLLLLLLFIIMVLYINNLLKIKKKEKYEFDAQ